MVLFCFLSQALLLRHFSTCGTSMKGSPTALLPAHLPNPLSRTVPLVSPFLMWAKTQTLVDPTGRLLPPSPTFSQRSVQWLARFYMEDLHHRLHYHICPGERRNISPSEFCLPGVGSLLSSTCKWFLSFPGDSLNTFSQVLLGSKLLFRKVGFNEAHMF